MAIMGDGEYTAHIQAEVARPRSSPVAIASNIYRITGTEVTVREPWQEIFFLSDPLRPSRLSGQQHLQGAPIYEYHTVQIVASGGGVDWPAILREARADLPAGTILLPPVTLIPVVFITGIERLVSWSASLAQETNMTGLWLTTRWTEGGWDSRQWQADVPTFLLGPPSTES